MLFDKASSACTRACGQGREVKSFDDGVCAGRGAHCWVFHLIAGVATCVGLHQRPMLLCCHNAILYLQVCVAANEHFSTWLLLFAAATGLDAFAALAHALDFEWKRGR
jgi:hypothetical protein